MKPNRDLCIMACVFCKEPLFWQWLNNAYPLPKPVGRFAVHLGEKLVGECKPVATHDEASAKAEILRVCGVASRNDLDRNPTSAELFHERIRKPYLAWKEGQHGA